MIIAPWSILLFNSSSATWPDWAMARPVLASSALQEAVPASSGNTPGDIRSGCHRYIAAPCQSQRVAHVTRAPPAVVSDHGDTGKLEFLWPAQQHRQRAQVIDIPAQVGIQVDFYHDFFIMLFRAKVKSDRFSFILAVHRQNKTRKPHIRNQVKSLFRIFRRQAQLAGLIVREHIRVDRRAGLTPGCRPIPEGIHILLLQLAGRLLEPGLKIGQRLLFRDRRWRLTRWTVGRFNRRERRRRRPGDFLLDRRCGRLSGG